MPIQGQLKEVMDEPGVSDIQGTLARGYFARALIAEREGDHTKAEEYLEKACEKELPQ